MNYTREFTIYDEEHAFYPVIYVRVTERSMIDPLFDTNPLLKVEMMDEMWNFQLERWIDITHTMSKRTEELVLKEWDKQYRADFDPNEESTVKLFPIGQRN